MPSRIWHVHRAEERLHGRRSGVFGCVPLAAMGTSSPSLQILANLLRDHKVLHAFEQSLALPQAHAEGLHRQFLTIDCQHLPALFVSVGTYAYHLDAHLHARNLQRCCIKRFNRSLASCKLNRSACNGPDSFNL
jgi:hypothetical protein